jgi:hypothetical protein
LVPFGPPCLYSEVNLAIAEGRGSHVIDVFELHFIVSSPVARATAGRWLHALGNPVKAACLLVYEGRA